MEGQAMSAQARGRFDRATLVKIGKGFLIAVTGGAAIAGLDYLAMVDIEHPLFAAAVATFVPVLVNAIKEWQAGE